MAKDPDNITRCPNCLRFVSDDRLLWHMDNACPESPRRDHVDAGERLNDKPTQEMNHVKR